MYSFVLGTPRIDVTLHGSADGTPNNWTAIRTIEWASQTATRGRQRPRMGRPSLPQLDRRRPRPRPRRRPLDTSALLPASPLKARSLGAARGFDAIAPRQPRPIRIASDLAAHHPRNAQGGGVRPATFRTFDRDRRFALAFARGCRRRDGPDGALECRPQEGSRSRRRRRSRPGEGRSGAHGDRAVDECGSAGTVSAARVGRAGTDEDGGRWSSGPPCDRPTLVTVRSTVVYRHLGTRAWPAGTRLSASIVGRSDRGVLDQRGAQRRNGRTGAARRRGPAGT